MKLARYIDQKWHHLCVRDRHVTDTLYTDLDSFTRASCDMKYSYLQDFDGLHSLESLAALEDRIRTHMSLSDHVYVGLGEPLLFYKTPSTVGIIKTKSQKDLTITQMISSTGSQKMIRSHSLPI